MSLVGTGDHPPESSQETLTLSSEVFDYSTSLGASLGIILASNDKFNDNDASMGASHGTRYAADNINNVVDPTVSSTARIKDNPLTSF